MREQIGEVEGAVVKQPGSSDKNKTGRWRIFKPVVTEKCTGCGLCEWWCPDYCIKVDKKTGKAVIDYEYCKGCGICNQECPSRAIFMQKEIRNEI